MGTADTFAGIRSDAVKKKTGKGWPEWFAILDRAGARKMPHREIAGFLYTKHGVPGWWAQMVTVGYEQARGLRQAHQTPAGFQTSASKTLAAPVGGVYRAWTVPAARRRWLPARFTVRKATRNKSLRITWSDGKTSVEVYFYPKGKNKSLCSVQHRKLAGKKDVARMKTYWAARLAALEKALQ